MNRLPKAASEKARRFLRRLRKDDEVARLFSLLNAQGEAFLFGGAARDVILGSHDDVADLDVVVAGVIDKEAIEREFGPARRTKLGGFRLWLGHYEVDFWELERSATLTSYPRSEVNLSRLLKNVCFSTDAVAIATSRFRLIADPLFVRTYESRLLEFVVPPETLDPKVVVRIARLLVKHRLEMSIAVASYFITGVENFGRESLVAAEAPWGSSGVLNEIRIEGVRAELSTAIDRAFSLVRLH